MDITIPDSNVAAGTQLPAANDAKSNELGQDSFMKLMLTQLRFQDPLKPVDNTEFIAQTAQFSSVAGINAMRDSLDKFVENQNALQALHSTSLLGKTAMIDTSEITLDHGKPTDIEYTLPNNAGTVNALFLDQTGAVVQQKTIGAQNKGTHTLSWNGEGEADSQLAPGNYSVRIEYPNETGEITSAQTSIAAEISSVSFGTSSSGAVLSTTEGREIKLSDVSKIKNI